MNNKIETRFIKNEPSGFSATHEFFCKNSRSFVTTPQRLNFRHCNLAD